jgi:hypothetical protein
MRVVSWIFVGSLFAILPAQGQVWSQQFPTVSPSARSEHGMAFDSFRSRTVLFGGSQGGSPLGDTWEWDGTNWLQRTPASAPSPRSAPMAYDSQRHRVVLFGGWQGGPNPVLGDTWEWDGNQWIPRLSAHFPPARSGAAMAYDSQRSRTVLFGGDAGPYTPGLLSDTWEWDGTDWTQRQVVSPPARWKPGMAYDSQRGRMVMFGGYGGGGGDLRDTWEWDGTTWTQRTTNPNLGARERVVMAFDSLRNRTVMFGGLAGALFIYDEVWEWDGNNWTQVSYSPAPPPRMDSAGAFHVPRGRVTVFSGSNGLADTWEWGGPSQVATTRTFGTGCGLSIAPATSSRPLLATAQLTDVTGIPSGSAFMAVGLSNTSVGPFALPLALDGFGLTGCHLYHDCIDFAEPCAPTGPGAARHSISVPNSTGLLGLRVYLQAWAPAPAVNPASQINSNAIELTVGNL